MLIIILEFNMFIWLALLYLPQHYDSCCVFEMIPTLILIPYFLSIFELIPISIGYFPPIVYLNSLSSFRSSLEIYVH